MEWRPRACADGARLATRGLRRGETRVIGPGQPRRGLRKDRDAMLLQRHQVLQGIDTRLETGGNEAREDAGNVGTVLRRVKQRVLALPNEEF